MSDIHQTTLDTAILVEKDNQIAMLKDELNCAEGEYENLKNKCNRLQARIDELEDENTRMKKWEYVTETKRKEIQAKGIRKMVNKIKKDYYDPATETTTDLIEIDEALKYADKLESKDE